MGDAMDGVIHGQRPIATPRPRIKKATVKKTSKRKSTGCSTVSNSATSLNPTPSKRVKVTVAQAPREEESWAAIAQNHTALLESHANFLSKLLAQSQPSSARTPALVGFLSRTHEMLAQVKTIEAISPPKPSSPAKPAPNTSLPRQRTPTPPKVNAKMEGLSENLSSIALANKKRSRSPSPAGRPEMVEEGGAESPMKKIKSAPETPVGGLKRNLNSKLGIRTAPRTPTVVMASISAVSSNFPSAKQEEKKAEVKTEVVEDEEVSLMEPDDFAAEVAARLKAKERKKHKLVEGSKGKRRRRSSTVDVGERREKRIKRESMGGGGEEVERKPRRRVSGLLRGESDAGTRGRS